MSNKIVINTNALLQVGEDFAKLQSSLDGISQQIKSALSATKKAAPTQYTVINSITSLKKRTDSASARARKLSGSVGKASAMWADCEKNLAGFSIDSGNPEEEKKGSWYDNIDFIKFLKTLVGKCGPIGSISKAIWSIIEGGDIYSWLKNGVDVGKGLYDIIKNFSDGFDWKKLIGIDSVKQIPLASWGDRWQATFQKTTTLAVIVSAVKSGIDNFKEWKEGKISFGRAVFEWGVETGGSILWSTTQKVLIGTLVGAAGLTGGWAVAATIVGGAVISWGVDKIARWVSGGEYGFVDGIGHLAGEAYDFGKKVVKKTADTVVKTYNNVKNTVKKGWNNIKTSFGNSFARWGAAIFG